MYIEFLRGGLLKKRQSEEMEGNGRILLRWILEKCVEDAEWIQLVQNRADFGVSYVELPCYIFRIY
jgi:hypothetical protein